MAEEHTRLFGTPRKFKLPGATRTDETYSYTSSPSSVAQKLYNHSRTAVCYVSYADKDPGRRFWRCPYRRFDDCSYMEWVDAETPNHLRSLLVKLMDSKQRLEEELSSKKQAERDLVNKVEAGAAIAGAAKDLVSTMSMQMKDFEKVRKGYQRSKAELVEMNAMIDKKVGNLTEVNAKLAMDRKLKAKLKRRRQVCGLLAIMLALFMIFVAMLVI